LVISSEWQPGFQAKELNVNKLTMMLIGLTILSSASVRTVAQAAEDSGTSMRGVHEIQVTLRKYEFSPGSLRVRKGERVKLVMAATDHDHGFKLAGTFQFHCSNVCGIGHRGMKGTLVVEE
jgi:heme/copper-type cytochrome/quinol oxidase subunit 2